MAHPLRDTGVRSSVSPPIVRAAGDVNPAAFPADETHGIALWPKNRLIVHSGGRSWRNLYVSLATEEPWRATLPAISHHCLAYCVNQSARITRTVDGERPVTTMLRPRHFGTIPAAAPSHWDVAGSPEIMLIYIRKSLMDTIAADVFNRDPSRAEIIPGLGVTDGLLEQLALAVLAELRQPDADDTLYADSLATTMASQLLRLHAAGRNAAAPCRPSRWSMSRPGLRRALDYIDSALCGPLGIEDMAAVAGLNPVYFARAFRQAIGRAPHQYVLERRIERAKRLLTMTDAALVEVALQAGFSSQSHFSTTFKRVVGVTPKDFRSAA